MPIFSLRPEVLYHQSASRLATRGRGGLPGAGHGGGSDGGGELRPEHPRHPADPGHGQQRGHQHGDVSRVAQQIVRSSCHGTSHPVPYLLPLLKMAILGTFCILYCSLQTTRNGVKLSFCNQLFIGSILFVCFHSMESQTLQILAFCFLSVVCIKSFKEFKLKYVEPWTQTFVIL